MARLRLYVYDPETAETGLTADEAREAARLGDTLARAHARYQMQRERGFSYPFNAAESRELWQAVERGRDALDTLKQLGVPLDETALPAAFFEKSRQ